MADTGDKKQHDPEWRLFEQAVEDFSTTKSDRHLAIVGAALIDKLLAACLRTRFRTDSKTVDELFEVGGALLDISAKACVAYALEVIDRDTFATIEGIYRARNLFAHNLEIGSFDTSDRQMAAALAKLRLSAQAGASDRERFLQNLRLCARLLMRIHAQAQQRPR